jgi:methylase of polypeptide subunit release factors
MNHEVPNFQAHTFLNTEGNHFYSRSMHSLDDELKFSYSKYIYDQLKSFKSKIRNVFEIGSGDGNILSSLSELFDSSGYGVDPSSIAVATGNAQFNNVELQVEIPVNFSQPIIQWIWFTLVFVFT